MDTTVTLKKSKTGDYITYSADDPLIGSIELVQTVKIFDVAQDKDIYEERSFKLYANVILLQKKVFQFEKIGYLPGRIYLKEFKEGSIPDEYRNKYLASNILDLEKHVKYCNETKSFVFKPALPALTSCGSKIYRFFGYDAYNSERDVVLEYDYIKSISNNNVWNTYKNTESFNTLTATQRMEQIFEDTRFKLPTYEDLNIFSKRTIPSQGIQDKSPSSITEKTNKSVVDKKDRFFPEDMTLWDYVKALLTIIVFIVLGILLLGEALGLINSGSSNEWRRP